MIQELVQEIERTAKSVVDDIHTALPGKVISYDPMTATVTIKPIGTYDTFNGMKLDYPVITDVPVVFPCSCSDVGIAFPVKTGDTCLLIISEVELDEWRSGAKSNAPLRFDLTSAIAIPGMISCNNELAKKAYEMDSVVICNKSTQITVSKSGMTVRGDLNVQGNINYTGTIKGD